MGGSLSPLGTTQCTFKLGDKEFVYTFIVCKHLLRPMIIGADFLKQYVLEYKHVDLVSSITVDESPQLLLSKTVKIPQRSLVVLSTRSTVNEKILDRYIT